MALLYRMLVDVTTDHIQSYKVTPLSPRSRILR